MSRPVVLFGTGSVAQLACYYLTHDSDREVAAFTVDPGYVSKPELFELPVVDTDELTTRFGPDTHDMFVVPGYSRMNKFREQKYHEAKAMGYRLISYISSHATVWPDLVIGDNCLIMEGNIIQPTARLGSNIIMWTACHVGHDTVIEDHQFFGSHTVVSGFVHIEPNCFLGVNSTIRDDIRLARETLVGAGAVVTKSTTERSVLAGPRPELLRITSDRLPKL